MKMNYIVPFFDTIERIFEQSPPKFLNDIQAKEFIICQSFLKFHQNPVTTFISYRRDIERLFQYSIYINMSLLEFKYSNIQEFIDFCKNPPQAWIGYHVCPRFIIKENKIIVNKKWRPFVVKLSKLEFKNKISKNINDFKFSNNSIKHLFITVSSFYKYLHSEELIRRNPINYYINSNKYKISHESKIRKLSDIQLKYLFNAARKMASEDSKHERTLFILSALYYMYLRVSELVDNEQHSPMMTDFFYEKGNWFFKTIGKGNKFRIIPVCDAMLDSLKRWRIHLKLSPTPNFLENTPLLPSLRNKTITTTEMIRHIMQRAFDRAAIMLKNDGLIEDAHIMSIATCHWLRHTGISDDVKIRPLEHVRDDAGHSSILTTNRYINVIMTERAETAKIKKSII